MTHKVKAKLKELLKDEHKAPKDYNKLKSLVRTKGEKKMVSRIISDEREHFRKLRILQSKYNRLGKLEHKKSLKDLD